MSFAKLCGEMWPMRRRWTKTAWRIGTESWQLQFISKEFQISFDRPDDAKESACKQCVCQWVWSPIPIELRIFPCIDDVERPNHRNPKHLQSAPVPMRHQILKQCVDEEIECTRCALGQETAP